MVGGRIVAASPMSGLAWVRWVCSWARHWWVGRGLLMPIVVELIPRCRVRRILRDRPAAMATRRGVERLGCPRVRRAGFLVWGRRRWGTGICRSLPRSRCSGHPATPPCGWISGLLTPLKPDPPGRSIDQARNSWRQNHFPYSVRILACPDNRPSCASACENNCDRQA